MSKELALAIAAGKKAPLIHYRLWIDDPCSFKARRCKAHAGCLENLGRMAAGKQTFYDNGLHLRIELFD